MVSTLPMVKKGNTTLDGSGIPVTRQTLMFLHISIDGRTRAVEVEGVSVHLTTSEFEILYLLACSPGKIFVAKEIYRCVWKMEDLGSIAPVRVHISRMRSKLFEACPEHKFIACEWKKGYRFIDVTKDREGIMV